MAKTKKEQTVTSKIASKTASKAQKQLTSEELSSYISLLEQSLAEAIKVQNAMVRIQELTIELEAAEKISEEALQNSVKLKNQIDDLRRKNDVQLNEYIDTTTGEIKLIES